MHRPELASYSDGEQLRPMLVWRFAEPLLAISSAPLGGGIQHIEWVINAGVSSGYARTDPAVHLGELAAGENLHGTGVGMLTAASVESWTWSGTEHVWVATTVGIRSPTWAAAEDGSGGGSSVGTINVIVVLPIHLSEAALVNAVMTATEAKSQALAEAGVPGTGTATDALVVACSTSGPAEQFAGPRSLWGARLARAVHSTIRPG